MKRKYSLSILVFIILIGLILTKSAYADYDLLIICPRAYESALQPLADHKNRTGIVTRIVTLDDIYSNYSGLGYVDDAERIKYAINDEYGDHNIKYVMLVGDGNVLPVRYTFGELDDYSPGRTPSFC